MKKLLVTLGCVVTFFIMTAVSASAVMNDMVKVGLRYASSALFSANLENVVGSGYAFGYYDSERMFQELGWTDDSAISMTAAGAVYLDGSGAYTDSGSGHHIGPWHIQLLTRYGDFDEAADGAADAGGWPAYLSGEFAVRLGSYDSRQEAERALESLGLDGEAVQSSSTGVLVTVTHTTDILFEFDCQGALNLGVLPSGGQADAITWFKGYQYPGGFEYARITGGNLNVTNVVNLEDYVKGVVPYEMNGNWPLAAMEAQAVCARTFACRTTKHLSAYGFDVCSSTDCQVYYGAGNGGSYKPTDASNEAVDNTAGEKLYYDGELAEAVYHASDGGATEDVKNVWGSEVDYLIGKQDPYEALITIPNYHWSVTYTAEQLTWILQQKNYSIGTVADVYIAETTPMGNVAKVTFVDTAGKAVTVKGDTCRSVFYSSTYGKSARSLRFTINGGSGGSGGVLYVNGASDRLASLDGVTAIAGSGSLKTLPSGDLFAITSSGKTTLSSGGGSTASTGTFTLTGTGNGHNVGMSQYGAKAMAENGYQYEDILKFYYTNITLG